MYSSMWKAFTRSHSMSVRAISAASTSFCEGAAAKITLQVSFCDSTFRIAAAISSAARRPISCRVSLIFTGRVPNGMVLVMEIPPQFS